ncbi:hypothetical protein ANO11243_034420 [Dothideomycetidae sp. 11243]|nr:hypothetical protein ANO11243_034420 [fungal sp. No.11243]
MVMLTDRRRYLDAAVYNLKDFVNKFGDDGKNELNNVASAHVIGMDETQDTTISYCGCDVHEGKLRILFAKGYFATNVADATYRDALQEALSKAGSSGSALDFNTRTGIKNDWDPKIGAVKQRLEAITGFKDLTITPNFEATFAALDGKPEMTSGWQKQLGQYTLAYFQGLVDNLTSAGFEKDDMLQEGLQEAMEKKEIKFEIVDKLSKGSYNEAVPEDGILYLRTVVAQYPFNTNQMGYQLLDLL